MDKYNLCVHGLEDGTFGYTYVVDGYTMRTQIKYRESGDAYRAAIRFIVDIEMLNVIEGMVEL